MSNWKKRPNETLQYKFDFAAQTNGREDADGDWLASGETISTINSVTVDSGITVENQQLTDSNTSVSVWLSGGTANTNYTVTVKATTSAGQIVEREKELSVITRY